MLKTRLEGDLGTFNFGVMQVFNIMQPQGSTGLSKSSKRAVFSSLLNKTWDFGVLHKTRLKGGLKTFTFGVFKFSILCSPEELQQL